MPSSRAGAAGSTPRGAVPSSVTAGLVVKTLGDGAMARFETPSDALAAGIAIQRAVRRAQHRDGDGLAVRVGVSAGEVTAENGDVFGTPVVEAARLCGAAAPGQVLATAAAAVLSRHGATLTPPVGPALRSRGSPEPVAVVEVEWTVGRRVGLGHGGLLPAPLRTVPSIPFVARSAGMGSARARRVPRYSTAAARPCSSAANPGAGKTPPRRGVRAATSPRRARPCSSARAAKGAGRRTAR